MTTVPADRVRDAIDSGYPLEIGGWKVIAIALNANPVVRQLSCCLLPRKHNDGLIAGMHHALSAYVVYGLDHDGAGSVYRDTPIPIPLTCLFPPVRYKLFDGAANSVDGSPARLKNPSQRCRQVCSWLPLACSNCLPAAQSLRSARAQSVFMLAPSGIE